MSDVRSLQEAWNAFGEDDPLGYVLGYPERRNDWDPAEFFATGEREIDAVLAEGARFGLPRRRARALDFGCGVGRLTQALCRHFESADGVDIAPSMIAAAERFNRHGGRCRYHLNDTDSLALFEDESFDLVYTALVLQHMVPELGRRYLGELVRVLRPGGLLVFQVPSGREPQEKLPRGAVLAELTLREQRLELEAGRRTPVHVRIRNLGNAVWPAHVGGRPIHVGNHWLDADGTLLRLDDGRAALPQDVEPGAEADVTLPVVAPSEPGAYVLEVDLVQEGVAWFAERRRFSRRRSRTARVPVSVVAASPDAGGPAEPGPRMEMHAIPRADVERILAERGARLLDVVGNDAAGAGWISLRYTATK